MAQALILLLLFPYHSTGFHDCITTSSVRDYMLIGHSYKTSSDKSLLSCVISCDRDQQCYSINYIISSKTCEFSDATRLSHPQKFIFSRDVVYIDHLSRPSGSCEGDRPCKNKGKCANVAARPGFVCHCQHNYMGDTCSVCSSPSMGMQDGRILDQQVTASSEGWWFLKKFKPFQARLWFVSASWVSTLIDSDPWLQVNFSPQVKLISGIATQGNPLYDWWTTSFILKFRMNEKTGWSKYTRGQGNVKIFSGNSDRNKVMKHGLSPPIKASLIRILPRTKHGRYALRLELYGCSFIED